MGKHWLYWIGSGAAETGGSSATRRRRRMPADVTEAAAVSGGCMRAVFHLFDFPSNHRHNLSDFHSRNCNALTQEARLEAPRNSVELNPDSILKEDNRLHLPARIKITTGRGAKTAAAVPSSPRLSSNSRTDDFSSESSSNSPGIKTPSVVARLMGLDLLPDTNSPRISSASSTSRQQTKFRNIVLSRRSNRAFSQDDISVGTGTAHSLPETPRMSSARRSDFDQPRLSLQINKDNVSDKPSSIRGRRFRFQPQDENRSPGHYARQIVKQVKQSVSRRVGLDITNTARHKDVTRRDENLILLKPTTKKPKTLSAEISPEGLNFKSTNTTKISRVPTSDNNSSISKPQMIIPLQEQNKKVVTTGKQNTSGVKKLQPFQATRNKKEETFVHPTATSKSDRKSKKTEILNISSPILLQAKKDPSPPLTKLPQKQLSSKQSHSYRQSDKRPTVKENVHLDSGGGGGGSPGTAAVDYGNYIQRILNLAGVDENSTASITPVKLQTPSHPIDPLIFHRIELFHLSAAVPTAALSRRCNRKLIFQVVDELLGEILKPCFNSKPWNSSAGGSTRKLPLVEELCRRIDGFPSAKCLVLEDIDSLIDKDLRGEQSNGDFEEERGEIVQEIEDEIVEWLVRETVAMVLRPAAATAGGAEKDWRKSRAAIHAR